MKYILTIMLSVFLSVLITRHVILQSPQFQAPTNTDRIKDFYLTETAVRVSPHTLRKNMDKGVTNYTLVDVRSAQEYEKEHIMGAINIPAYKDPNTSIALDTDKEQTERIISSFTSLPKDRDIIVYCYSTACMTGRKIGKLLVENNIYVKHLGVGWNEWRYAWDSWNHDSETPSDWQDYVVTGKEPGKPTVKNSFSPCVQGELGC